MKDLLGKTAIITGSSRNLGRATAKTMAVRGANVIINALSSASEVDRVVNEIGAAGGKAIGVLADVTTPAGVALIVERAHEAFGDVHILVSNVGIRDHAQFPDMTLDLWRRVVGTKLEAAFLLSQAVMPDMVRNNWGRIVYISGVDAFWGKTGKAALTTANLGLVGLARSLAVEYAMNGVTVNTVVPGAMHTTRKHTNTYYPGYAEKMGDLFRRIPMGRPGEPQELAEVVTFLASPGASYVTAQTIHVNGGVFPTSADPFAAPTFPYDAKVVIPTEEP